MHQTCFIDLFSDLASKGFQKAWRLRQSYHLPMMQEGAEPVQEFYQVELVRELGNGSKNSEKYLIGQALGGGSITQRASEASAAFGVPVRPFAGVAARLHNSAQGEDSMRFSSDCCGQSMSFVS